jgi:tetratricopeptide (TPR) repeat protein
MNIKTKIISLLQIALIIILIIILLHHAFSTKPKYSRETEKLFNLLEGEDIAHADETIKSLEKEPELVKDSEYYLRKGVIYQHNLKNPQKAKECYQRALTLLKTEKNNNYIHVTDRIIDNIRLGNANQMEPLALRAEELQEHFIVSDLYALATKKKPLETSSDKAKVIEQKIEYNSDPQNVHDSTINNDFLTQYNRIKKYNNDEGIYYDIKTFSPSNKNVINVIKSFDNKTFTSLIGNDSSREFINHIYTRIMSKDNIKNRDKLLEMLETQLKDCATSNNGIVCIAGRHTRLLSTFATLDKDPSLGILRSKEMIRNELLNDAAQIVERGIGEKSKTPKNIIDEYNNNIESPGVLELKAKMAAEIEGLRTKYNGLIPDAQLDLLIKQSLDVIL